jgi:glycosyltransferase involved in cell wall biosynthesis
LTQLIDQEVGVESDRIVKISGGIDDNWITSTPSKIIRPLKFVFLGRHERRKGILELHRTLEQNPQWAAQMNFSIIGPIPEASRLQMSHLTYLGQVNSEEKLKKELSESDVLVCPSHSEGMPTVIMEAMARGLAILATDVGAVGDLVSRTNGILMTEPSLVQITNAINRVLDMSDQELASLKANSLQMAESFRWSAVAAKTIAKISRLIS